MIIYINPIFRVELAVWTHSVASDLKPELLQDMPDLDKLKNAVIGGTNGTTHPHPADSITTTAATEQSDESNAEAATEEQKETKQRTANGKGMDDYCEKGY